MLGHIFPSLVGVDKQYTFTYRLIGVLVLWFYSLIPSIRSPYLWGAIKTALSSQEIRSFILLWVGRESQWIISLVIEGFVITLFAVCNPSHCTKVSWIIPLIKCSSFPTVQIPHLSTKEAFWRPTSPPCKSSWSHAY